MCQTQCRSRMSLTSLDCDKYSPAFAPVQHRLEVDQHAAHLKDRSGLFEGFDVRSTGLSLTRMGINLSRTDCCNGAKDRHQARRMLHSPFSFGYTHSRLQ